MVTTSNAAKFFLHLPSDAAWLESTVNKDFMYFLSIGSDVYTEFKKTIVLFIVIFVLLVLC